MAQEQKSSFRPVSRDQILCHVTKYSTIRGISAALARGFSDRHFEREEGPGSRLVLARTIIVFERR